MTPKSEDKDKMKENRIFLSYVNDWKKPLFLSQVGSIGWHFWMQNVCENIQLLTSTSVDL